MADSLINMDKFQLVTLTNAALAEQKWKVAERKKAEVKRAVEEHHRREEAAEVECHQKAEVVKMKTKVKMEGA
ncbi:hypothetical protein NM688_g3426 [Phlebia brevispora]|uniref:Uncharacterized protein n=1 Tax=Phlebia brevispora TaxID=194682 RepID=A0ACC1T605_9APHY|nr:hypothetical protein NM688_g3426 [Phlebia brevispora]